MIQACAIAGSKSALARAVGVKPPTVQEWCNGARPVPPAKCVAIERATGGKIGRRDLMPEGWEEIWPELADDVDKAKVVDDVQPPGGAADPDAAEESD